VTKSEGMGSRAQGGAKMCRYCEEGPGAGSELGILTGTRGEARVERSGGPNQKKTLVQGGMETQRRSVRQDTSRLIFTAEIFVHPPG
jgi:hypothetical protein